MGAEHKISRAAPIAGAAIAATCLFAMSAQAATISGSANGLSWTASSTIVGQTSTATGAAGGNPLYFPQRPFQNGVVALIMQEAGGTFICSGSLLSDRRSVLTAGHCVSGGAGTDNPIATTAWFYGGPNPDAVVPFNPAATAIDVSQYFVNPEYTGQVVDQNDIAVLRLSEVAPDWATSYDLYSGPLEGKIYDIAGYGLRSDTGGALGVNLGTGRLRTGQNRYDFSLGDDAFGGFFTGTNFFGTAEYAHSWISDFDNGTAFNDGSCALSVLGFGNAPDAQFCDLGVGAREVSTAGGDSGGPQFVNGKLASVTSYGLSFGTGFGDTDDVLNSSFGEFNGLVPVGLHLGFIRGAMVPEPATWALMIGGFGMLGGALRRRRSLAA